MTGSTVTITCWGCNKSETHPMQHGAALELQEIETASRGWVRRAFTESTWDKGPWFCSLECAHESFNAKRAEQWWSDKEESQRQLEFQKYCRETALPKLHYYFVIFIVIVITSIIIKEVLNVGIQ